MTLTKSGKTTEIEMFNFECTSLTQYYVWGGLKYVTPRGVNYGFLWKSVGLLNTNYTP